MSHYRRGMRTVRAGEPAGSPTCMRKLLVILNTMIKNNEAWKPKMT